MCQANKQMTEDENPGLVVIGRWLIIKRTSV